MIAVLNVLYVLGTIVIAGVTFGVGWIIGGDISYNRGRRAGRKELIRQIEAGRRRRVTIDVPRPGHMKPDRAHPPH